MRSVFRSLKALKQVVTESEEKSLLTIVPKEPEKTTVDLSPEQRIQQVEDLSTLIEKWRKLTETSRNLQTFSLGSDSMGATVFLRDATGKEFKT